LMNYRTLKGLALRAKLAPAGASAVS